MSNLLIRQAECKGETYTPQQFQTKTSGAKKMEYIYTDQLQKKNCFC